MYEAMYSYNAREEEEVSFMCNILRYPSWILEYEIIKRCTLALKP